MSAQEWLHPEQFGEFKPELNDSYAGSPYQHGDIKAGGANMRGHFFAADEQAGVSHSDYRPQNKDITDRAASVAKTSAEFAANPRYSSN